MPLIEDSRNVWLRPTYKLSNDANFKDGFEDILRERRQPCNDLTWLFKNTNTPKYKYYRDRTSKQIAKDVLSSDRVKYAVGEVSVQTKTSKGVVWKEAQSIVQEMAHNLSLNSVRGLGFVLCKVLKQLFRHVYVNVEGVRNLSDMMKEYPVLLMPSHRSYFDFLLLSYVCFHYDLSLPTICAGQDFMNMALFGKLLRESGAFYIRRSFGTDQLYWAVFTEYVQTHLANGDHPVEFFVEGTRSRTQKSLTPKLGMLSASLESYFKSMVPDIIIVPVSISYDRIIEENLFAYELLGVPKPKESTMKLLQATSILQEDYGNMHIVFGHPASVRQLAFGKLYRSAHGLYPRYIAKLASEEDRFVAELGYLVIRAQQASMMLSVWSLVATVLLQADNHGTTNDKNGRRINMTFNELVQKAAWLKQYALNVGAHVDWPPIVSDVDVVKSALLSHSHTIAISDDGAVTILTGQSNTHVSPPVSSKEASDRMAFYAKAAVRIRLSIYRNMATHSFVKIGLLSTVLNNTSPQGIDSTQAFAKFKFLAALLSQEFLLSESNVNRDFDEALDLLSHMSDVSVINDVIKVEHGAQAHVAFFSNMFLPYLTAYWLCYQVLMSLSYQVAGGQSSALRPRDVALTTQAMAMKLIQSGNLQHYETMSLDILNNSLQMLVKVGGAKAEPRGGQKFLLPRQGIIKGILDQLEFAIDISPTAVGSVFSKMSRL